MTIGILGLQGCCVPHERKLAALGVSVKRILYPRDLDAVEALILPGGESTTMLKLQTAGLWDKLVEYGRDHSVWGVCAGCILQAAKVTEPQQPSLGLLDIDVVRNAYGAQNESFVAPLHIGIKPTAELKGIFIRAPRISRIGSGLRVLSRHGEEPVMVENDQHLATTFHPELSSSTCIHEYFLDKVRQKCGRDVNSGLRRKSLSRP